MNATYRQFMWGLSNGIMVLVLSGVFWFGLAVSSVRARWPFYLGWEAPILAAAGSILAGAFRVRKRAMGFAASDIKRASGEQRVRSRKISLRFLWTIVGEVQTAWLFIFFSYAFERPDLVWPVIALAFSLHFFPLAHIFRVRLYYSLAAFGSIISLGTIMAPEASLSHAHRLEILGIGMGTAVWITAAYAILKAGQLAREWEHAQ